jgi:hypothetical protein
MSNMNQSTSSDTKLATSAMMNEGSPVHGQMREAFGQSVHDVAEDARLSVVKAVQSAADKLKDFDAGQWRATEATNSYAHKISAKLDKFSSMLAGKDSMDIADDLKSMAKKYQTPLIVSGLALAFLMFRPGRSHNS